MNETEFAAKMKNIIGTAADLGMETPLADIEEWDSLAKLSAAAFFNAQFKVKIGLADFNRMKTVGDLYAFCKNEQ